MDNLDMFGDLLIRHLDNNVVIPICLAGILKISMIVYVFISRNITELVLRLQV